MIVRIILMLIGIAGIVVFYLPMGKKGIANVGNITGIIISVLTLLFGTFSWLFSRNFKIVLLVLVLILLAIFIRINVLMSRAKHNRAANESVVIVLGCSSKYYVSDMLNARIKEAARYLDKHKDAVCIASGGVGTDFYNTEAEYIAVGLAKYGIERSRIITETTSKTTYENLRNAAKIINEKNLPKAVAISTNEFHQYRAGLCAMSYSLEPHAINVLTDKILYPTFYLREMFAIVKLWILKK